MEIIIGSFKPQEVVKILARHFKVKPHSKGAEITLNLPKKAGQGYIKGIDFHYGLGMIRFDCEFNRTITIKYNGGKQQPFRFLFCIEGLIVHVLEPDNLRYKLSPLSCSIVAGSNHNNQVFKFPAKKKISFNTLDINKEQFYPKIRNELKSVPERLANAFKDIESKEHFLYQTDYNLTIAECLHEINYNGYSGLIRRIFLESKALDLLWMQIKQYSEEQRGILNQVNMRKNDLELIMKAKRILCERLKDAPTIKELAKLVGTNETKLKKGFKKLYGKTIYNYLRHERLNRAKVLLAEEQLSVKEVAEAVGYTNRSAFARRFREKFGVLPGKFLKKYKGDTR